MSGLFASAAGLLEQVGRGPRLAPWVCSIASTALFGADSAPGRIERLERLRAVTTWQIDYACKKPAPRGRALVVHDPDATCSVPARARGRTVRLAYLSVGEIHESLPMFAAVERAGAVIGANPDWPGARYLDVTHEAYERAYLMPRARQIAAADFDGFFLDTIDAALARRRDGVGLADARGAVLAAVHALRDLWPSAIVVPNGGLELRDAAPAVDGWAIEDVFGGYDFARKTYVPTQPARRDLVLPALRHLRDEGLPIFELDYAPRESKTRRAELLRWCGAERFHCAVSTIVD